MTGHPQVPAGETDAHHAYYAGLQARFAAALERLDGHSTFVGEQWERPDGGGGDTRVLQGDGPVEKAAVNVSAVWGDTPERLSDPAAAKSSRFYATGISIIVHPRNPHAPTFHANLRYFETSSGAGEPARRWFGGGLDLTPFYLYEEDAAHFHRVARDVCRRHRVADHPAWKRACDEYFHLPHRGEARGIGGLFFDHLTDDLDEVWDFQCDLGDHLEEAYLPILERRVTTPFTDAQRIWQERRRGRYAEFNLVWDRGTRFGLETGGRTESILSSLPPRVRWDHGHAPAEGTAEWQLLMVVQGPPREW